jgi:hypothetical protein
VVSNPFTKSSTIPASVPLIIARADFTPVIDQIKRRVSIPDLLGEFHWHTRYRRRADCGLCKGSSVATVSFDERLWHCHRCKAGGDIFTLVEAVRDCDFKDALRWLADYARLELPDRTLTREERNRIDEAQRQRQELEQRAEWFAAQDRGLRLTYRDYLHHCHAVVGIISDHLETLDDGQEFALRWSQLATYIELTLEFDTPYCIVSFAPDEVRTRFVIADDAERQQMIRDLRGLYEVCL